MDFAFDFSLIFFRRTAELSGAVYRIRCRELLGQDCSWSVLFFLGSMMDTIA